MRALLGWFLVLACCGLFGYLQLREGSGLHAGAEGAGTSGTTIEEREGAWRKVTIGRPSGAPPLDLEEWLPEDDQALYDPSGEGALDEGPEQDGQGREAPPQPPQPATAFEYKVPKGRVLSKICEEFYGTGRSPVPERVAEFNRMESPDDLRAGQTLHLPAWEVLFPNDLEPR